MNRLRFLIAAPMFLMPLTALAVTGNTLHESGKAYNSSGSSFDGGFYKGYISSLAEVFLETEYCPPEKFTDNQAAAIVWKWLKANPERWAEPGANVVLAALKTAFPCKK